MNHSNIILTGLPRSGTTLTCHLLNKINNTVALHEPMTGNFTEGATKQEICIEIAKFFASSRKSILENKQIFTSHVNEKIPDNIFGDEKCHNGLRKNLTAIEKTFLKIEKDVSENFPLCIKQNALFTLLLDELTSLFPCYAIIRNPLAILASWNSVDLPINKGHIPVAEKLDRKLSLKLGGMPDKIERQFYILSWFFHSYKKSLSPEKIIRYEDIISSGGSTLQAIIPDASKLSECLTEKNLNRLYNKDLMRSLGERLLVTEGAFWHFYAHEDIEKLLSEIT